MLPVAIFSVTPSASDAEHDSVAHAPVDVCSATAAPSTVISQLTDPLSSATLCTWTEDATTYLHATSRDESHPSIRLRTVRTRLL